MTAGRWLVARLVPAEWRESVLGDLEEEQRRRHAQGRRAGSIWFLIAALPIVLALGRSRWRRTERPRLSAPFSGVLLDIRISMRALRSSPGFTLVAVVVLTLGLGITTAIFSVVDAVLLRRLPFEDADTLVAVGEISTTRPVSAPAYVGSVAAPNYQDWLRQQTVFESMGAAVIARGFVVRDGAEPEDLNAIRATASLFDVLRIRPALGGLFTAAEEVSGRDAVVLIGHHLWERRFAADPGIVGKTLTVDSGTFRIIGVLPPGFTYPAQLTRPIDVVAPYVVPERERVRNRNVTGRNYTLRAVARLKPGVSVEQARAEIARITAGLAREFPDWFEDQASAVYAWHDTVVGRSRGWMQLLLGAIGCILLIACANIANLMLARGTGRSRELFVRAALGASRWRLARSIVVESLLLTGLGLVAAVLAASWGVGVLRASMPGNIPRLATVNLDLRVLLVAAAAAIVTGLICGLAPALQLSRPDVARELRDGARAGHSRRRERLRSALVVVEVALATLLLVGAGLFTDSFRRLVSMELGLDPRHVVTASINPRLAAVSDAAFDAARRETTIVVDRLLEEWRARPEVEAVAAVSGGSPLSGNWRTNSITVPAKPEFTAEIDQVQIRQVTPGYLDVVRVPLRRGRYIRADDTAGAPLVVVVNEEVVRRFFDGRDPVGTFVRIDDADRTIVGVVGNVRLRGPEVAVSPEAYLPMAQFPSIGGTLLVRAKEDVSGVEAMLRASVLRALPGVPVVSTTLEQSLRTMTASRRFNMLLVGLVGVVAVLIAVIGIYGVMAYAVLQRTREIGVRMALGAKPLGVVALVLGRASWLMAIGLACGLAGAWALAGSVEAFLFGVTARDPSVFGAVSVALFAAGLVAAAVPARRAARVDPIRALRAE